MFTSLVRRASRAQPVASAVAPSASAPSTSRRPSFVPPKVMDGARGAAAAHGALYAAALVRAATARFRELAASARSTRVACELESPVRMDWMELERRAAAEREAQHAPSAGGAPQKLAAHVPTVDLLAGLNAEQ